MKKIRIVIGLLILTFSFSVKAMVFMEIDCDSENISSDNSVTCSANFVYDGVSVSDIDLEYQTNLKIDFIPLDGFNFISRGNKISVHPDKVLKDFIISSKIIFKFKLSLGENNSEKEAITFKNFMINKENREIVPEVSKSFNITAPKPLDNDCYLNSITVDKVSVPDFNKETLEYRNIIVTKDVVFIDVVRSSDKSSATGLGQVYVDPGKTIEHSIHVVAEDKSEKVYKLYITNKSPNPSEHEILLEKVKNEEKEVKKEEEAKDKEEIRELSKDNTLKSLELFNNKEKINFTFDSKKEDYKIELANSDISKLTIKALVNDSKASFISGYGPRDINIDYGDNKILIKVVAENKDEKTYSLNISRPKEKSKDSTLRLLKVNNEEIKLVKDIYEYEITLKEEIAKTKIEALANDEKASVKYKDIELVDGKNEVIITVISENNDKKEYKINIIRNNELKLESIQIAGYDLNFSKEKNDYTLKVNDDTYELKIIVNPSNIEYEEINNKDLKNGSIVTIKVKENDVFNEYNIKIIKEESKINENNDSNNWLIYFIIGIITVLGIGIIIYIILKKKKNQKEDIEII